MAVDGIDVGKVVEATAMVIIAKGAWELHFQDSAQFPGAPGPMDTPPKADHWDAQTGNLEMYILLLYPKKQNASPQSQH